MFLIESTIPTTDNSNKNEFPVAGRSDALDRIHVPFVML